jgi:DNA repair photolyase
VDGYEATSGRGELVVTVADDGVPLGVRLSPAVMNLPAEELASRIVRLARLRDQLAVDQEPRWSAAQVTAYAQTIDF